MRDHLLVEAGKDGLKLPLAEQGSDALHPFEQMLHATQPSRFAGLAQRIAILGRYVSAAARG